MLSKEQLLNFTWNNYNLNLKHYKMSIINNSSKLKSYKDALNYKKVMK